MEEKAKQAAKEYSKAMKEVRGNLTKAENKLETARKQHEKTVQKIEKEKEEQEFLFNQLNSSQEDSTVRGAFFCL